MTTLKTINDAIKFINSRKNKGVNFIINDCLHFGVSFSVHVYSNIAKDAAVEFEPKTVFTILSTDELPIVLSYILSMDKSFKVSV